MYETSAPLVCFVALIDKVTAASLGLARKSTTLSVWNLEVLERYPFREPRSNGKIPKLLIQVGGLESCMPPCMLL